MNFKKAGWTALLLVVGIGLTFSASAATIRVPQDQPTITAGIAAANAGDTVAVSAGTYYEFNIPITNAITLTSLSGPTNTIIDSQYNGRGLIVSNVASGTVNIFGFTIQNAEIPYYNGGGAVWVETGQCTISNCIIQGVSGAADYSGNAIGNQNTNADAVVIENTIIRNNFAANNVAIANSVVLNCLIYGNTGGNDASALSGCNATNCTVYGNGGGYLPNPWTVGGGSGGNWDNCIVWNNLPSYNNQEIYQPISVNYCIVEGGFAGTGNLGSDPLFVNAANGDFHLQTNSPAINAGDPSILNPNGTRSNIGFSYCFNSQSFLTNGLVAYYPFNGNANDASGNGNNANVQGTFQYLTNGTLHLIGDGALFYSGGGYVALPNYGNLNSGFTISIWVANETDHGTGILAEYYVWFDNNNNGNDGAVYISQHDSEVADQNTNADFPFTIASYTPWKQLVLAYSPGNCAAYLDGTNIGSVNATINPFPMVNSAIGRHWWNDGVNSSARMTMDVKDCRIYNRALSTTEVEELYAYESGAQPATPPSITSQPQPVTVNAGSIALFSLTAYGSLPLNYQWSFNSTNISGATSSSLTISNVAQTNLGTYAVVVSNAFGSVISSNALLSMYPYIKTPFTGVITDWGQNATLSVQAWGTGPLSYQWFDNGVAVQNATNQTLTLASIQFTNAGLYSVVVTSPLGSVTNTPEQVVVNPAGVSLGLYPGLTVTGTVGYTYAIQATSDLSNSNGWTTMATLTLQEPVQLWIDTTDNTTLHTNAARFYRVIPGQ